MKLPDRPDLCELCRRPGCELTKHHLFPRATHRSQSIRKQTSREQRVTAISWLCRPCHSAIHRFISEKQMARQYHTIERLKQHEEVIRFCQWIADKPSGFKPKF